MKTEEKTTNKTRATLPLIDSYDNELYMMMLEEIGAIKGEQCLSVSMPTPTESK